MTLKRNVGIPFKTENEAFGSPLFLNDDFEEQSTSSYDWETLYTGYPLEPYTGNYHVRYRTYHPALGRWMIRDPLFIPGRLWMSRMLIREMSEVNYYAFIKNQATNKYDVLGLSSHMPTLGFPSDLFPMCKPRCGGAEYDPGSGEQCCNGSDIAYAGQECCGSTATGPGTDMCCQNGNPVEKIFRYKDLGFYEPRECIIAVLANHPTGEFIKDNPEAGCILALGGCAVPAAGWGIAGGVLANYLQASSWCSDRVCPGEG